MTEEVLFYLMLMGFIMVSLILNHKNQEKIKIFKVIPSLNKNFRKRHEKC